MEFTDNKLITGSKLHLLSYELLPKIKEGTYSTDLLHFRYSTGKLSPVRFNKGPRGGNSLLFEKTRLRVVASDLLLNHKTGELNIRPQDGVIFVSSYISELLPKLEQTCTENIEKYEKYLKNWKAKLAGLHTVQDDFPEYFI
jgi:hypothetical protein